MECRARERSSGRWVRDRAPSRKGRGGHRWYAGPERPVGVDGLYRHQGRERNRQKVEAEGGKVVAPPFDVMDVGRMAVFQDPSGAFISAWEPKTMNGFEVQRKPGSFSWVELNSRAFEKAT